MHAILRSTTVRKWSGPSTTSAPTGRESTPSKRGWLTEQQFVDFMLAEPSINNASDVVWVQFHPQTGFDEGTSWSMEDNPCAGHD